MGRFLFIVVLILVIIGCVGFYQGWFRIGSETTDGKTHVTFTVDKNKIKADENKVLDKVHGGGSKSDEPVAPVPPNQDSKD